MLGREVIREFWGSICSPAVLISVEDRCITVQPYQRPDSLRASLWRFELREGLCKQGIPQDVEALGGEIGDFLIQQGLVRARVMATLPQAAIRLHHLDLEAWSEEQRQRLFLDPHRALVGLKGLRKDDVLDLKILEPAESGHCLLTVCSSALIQAWIEVFFAAGVELIRLEPAQLCWTQALMPLLRTAPVDQLVVLVHSALGALGLMAWRACQPVYQWAFSDDYTKARSDLEACLRFLFTHESGPCPPRVIWDGDGCHELDAMSPHGYIPIEKSPAAAQGGELSLLGALVAENHGAY